MRVGKDNRWGYSFLASSGVSVEQEVVLGAMLCRLDDDCVTYFTHSTYQPDGQKHYLPKDIKSIFGVGPEKSSKSVGVIWSMDEKHTLESLFYAVIDHENDFYPYKVKDGKCYYVKDGQVYEE